MVEVGDFPRLIEEARKGDRSAIDRILREYGSPVMAAIRAQLGRRLRGKMDSMDIFQTAVKSALGSLERFQGDTPEAFIAWLTGIARHDILDKAKYFGTEKHRLEREQPLTAGEDTRSSVSFQLPGEDPTPSQNAVGDEAGLLLEGILDSLPEAQRRVVLLERAGRSSAEIARELGLAPRTVRRRYAEALTRIRRELERRGYGGE